MTLVVPLAGAAASAQSTPAFVAPADDPAALAAQVLSTLLRAKRIAVVCGAGISVQAGIPDFRSADGLFQSIKRENPREALSSGKDLFDASVLNSEHTAALFFQMMARLAHLSSDAAPTPFHELLRALDARGKLLRVYTQNIDALEEKAGMSFGLPVHRAGRARGKAKMMKGTGQGSENMNASKERVNEASSLQTTPFAEETVTTTTITGDSLPLPSSSSSRARETPRCIPLHGTLQTMHCVSCTRTFPLADHLPSLHAGVPPACPECTALEETRSLVGKRPRAVGRLRPSVVLYNEDHRDAEGVGAVVRRDLARSTRGAGADVLLVAGTSLRVPGTKRIVREFAKAVRARERARAERAHEAALARAAAALPTPAQTPTPTSSPTPSPRRTPVIDEEAPGPGAITTVYVNLDFPVPTREWDGVFDVWVQGDAQVFAGMLREEMEREERERAEKAERDGRAREERRAREEKRKRERGEEGDGEVVVTPKKKVGSPRKRAAPAVPIEEGPPTKRRRVNLIVRDPTMATPPSSHNHEALPSPTSAPRRAAKRVNPAKSRVKDDPSPHVEVSPIPPAKNARRNTQVSMERLGHNTSRRQSGRSSRSRLVPEVLIDMPRPPSRASRSLSSLSGPADSSSASSSSEATNSAQTQLDESAHPKNRRLHWEKEQVQPRASASPLDLLAHTAASQSRVHLSFGRSEPSGGRPMDEFAFSPPHASTLPLRCRTGACVYPRVVRCTCHKDREHGVYERVGDVPSDWPTTPQSVARINRARARSLGRVEARNASVRVCPGEPAFSVEEGEDEDVDEDVDVDVDVVDEGVNASQKPASRQKRERKRTLVQAMDPIFDQTAATSSHNYDRHQRRDTVSDSSLSSTPDSDSASASASASASDSDSDSRLGPARHMRLLA